MNDAGAGGSGSPAHQVRYGYDIFCDGQNVQRKGGNEGGVWEAFSRCLHMRVCRPDKQDRNRNKGRPPDSGEQGDRINALLDPRNQEEYEETVDLAAREIFRIICLVDKRKFLQATTCQPILDKDVIEILKVELKAVRNEVKVEMKRDYQQRQHQHQLRQQEQARRDEERSRRDREEFERESKRSGGGRTSNVESNRMGPPLAAGAGAQAAGARILSLHLPRMDLVATILHGRRARGVRAAIDDLPSTAPMTTTPLPLPPHMIQITMLVAGLLVPLVLSNPTN